MRHVLQRLGFRATRGLAVLLLIAGVLSAAAFWIGPLRPAPAELHLVAASEGQYQQVVRMPASVADTFSLDGAAVGRYPLVLAMYNTGARAAEPVQLALSLPGQYRLTNSRGEAYPPRTVPGNPLTRYVFDLKPTVVPPGETPLALPGLDTLWLEPTVPSYYCTTFSDSIPEFVPAPPQNPALLANVNIFYSFATRSSARQTGILTIQLDPEAVRRDVAAPVNTFPTTIREPEVRRPQVPALFLVGTRVSQCGDAAYPLQIHSTLYRTPDGGRVFVLSLNNVVRKYLYDLNRDSIIELEIWDPDNDGLFEAGRPARMPIPEFLMPLRPPRTIIDSLLTDSTGAPLDSAAIDSLRAMRDTLAMRADSLSREAARVRAFRFPPELFWDTTTGPLRFWRAMRAPQTQQPTQPQPRRPTEPQLIGEPVRPRVQQPTVRLLGVPVDSVRRPRPDTMRRDTSSLRPR